MGSILVFVHYNGDWDNDNNYNNFQVVGVAIDPGCDYNGLKQLVADQLKINTVDHVVVMKYQPKPAYPPLSIDSDASLEFYKELKKKEYDYTRFPVCTTIVDQGQCSNHASTTITHHADVGDIRSAQLQRLRNVLLTDVNESTFSLVDFASDAANSIVSDVDQFLTSQQKISSEANKVIFDDVADGGVFVGQLFENEDLLKRTMRFWAMSEIFSFRAVKSCPKQYFAACVDRKCGWFVKASVVGQSRVFKVRSMYTIHTCPLDVRMNEQRQATAEVVSHCIKRKFCDLKTTYTPADIIRDMKDDYGVELSYKKAWRARKKAVDEVRGKPDESYRIVAAYLEKVTEANPGSFARVKKSDDNNFQYLFMSLYASIKGWHNCRPIVVVDGTFLKASYGGTLLTASVQDANGHIMPIAFAIVDSENDKSYEWFFESLLAAVGTRPGMCIVSDRNESLLKAVTKVYVYVFVQKKKNCGAFEIYPGVAHCCCMYHLGNNLKRHFKKNMQVVRQKFVSAAMAYTVDDFNKHMNELKLLDPRVVEYLKGVGYEQWARAHCPHNRFLSMTSNIAESLNAALRFARELPVTTLLECLRALQQKWNVANGDEAKSTFTTLSKKGHDMLEDNYKMSLRMTIGKANDSVYQVSIGQSVFVVDLERKVCTCNRFQMDELPCPHAVSVLRGLNEDPVKYCSKYYYRDTMVATYKETVYPVGRDAQFATKLINDEEEIILPPVGRVRAGRPKRSRTRSVGEYPNKTRCSKCKEQGHNIKTCTRPPSS